MLAADSSLGGDYGTCRARSSERDTCLLWKNMTWDGANDNIPGLCIAGTYLLGQMTVLWATYRRNSGLD